MNDMDHERRMQSRVYLLLVYAVCFGLEIAALLTKNETRNQLCCSRGWVKSRID